MDRYPIPHPSVLREIIHQEKPAAPLTAMIHIAEHCNVRCEFCWHHSFLKKDDHRRPQRMETSAVIRIVQDLEQMGTKDITLSANGEPTAHPGFSSIVHAIKNAGMKLKVVTNLTLFSPPIATALARADHLIINLAATNQATYQSIYAPRGELTFAQVIENIKALSRIQQHGGPQLKIGYVITKNSYRQIPEAIMLAHSCGVSSIRFKFMDPLDFTQSLILDNNDRQFLRDQIIELLKNPLNVSNNLNDILEELSASTIKDNGSKEIPKHGRCFVGWIVININEDGSVTLCCQNDHLIIGNWKEKSLRSIWEGKKAQEFRHSAKTKIDFNHPLWHACKTCHYSNPEHYAHRNFAAY